MAVVRSGNKSCAKAAWQPIAILFTLECWSSLLISSFVASSVSCDRFFGILFQRIYRSLYRRLCHREYRLCKHDEKQRGDENKSDDDEEEIVGFHTQSRDDGSSSLLQVKHKAAPLVG